MWFIILTWLVHFAVCERNYSLISQIIALDNKGTSTCFFSFAVRGSHIHLFADRYQSLSLRFR